MNIDFMELQKQFMLRFDRKMERGNPELESLWSDLIYEEKSEWDSEFDKLTWSYEHKYFSDLEKVNWKNVTAELADLVYVIMGYANAMQLPLKEFFLAIHEANMRKLDDKGKPVLREDGKILKPAGWKPADLDKLWREYGEVK